MERFDSIARKPGIFQSRDALALQRWDALPPHLLREKLRDARERRNSVVPIAVLPVEVLCEIFMQDACHPEVLMRVCRRWREVAISRGEVWTRIGLMAGRQMQLYIERSKTMPLDISIPQCEALDERAERLLYPHLHRARSLDLGFTTDSRLGALYYLQRPAPSLESLRLTEVRSQSDLNAVLPNLFDGVAPRLRNVRLNGCYVEWTSPILSRLTSLALRGLPWQGRLTVAEAVHILECCPVLNNLELSRALRGTDVDSSPHPPLPALQLSSLRSFDISSEGVLCVDLLNRVSFPSTASLSLDCPHFSDTSRMPDMLKLVAEAYSCGYTHTPGFLSLDILIGSHFRIFVTLSAISPDLSAGPSFHKPGFLPLGPAPQVAKLHFPGDHASGIPGLITMVKALKLARLRHLFVTANAYDPDVVVTLTPDQWREIDVCCPNLQAVGARDRGVANALWAMTLQRNDDQDAGNSQAAQVPFRNVRSIAIHCVSFAEGACLSTGKTFAEGESPAEGNNAAVDGESTVKDRSLLDLLRDCLASRQNNGFPVETLHISLCRHVSWAVVASLEKLVGSVVWDRQYEEGDTDADDGEWEDEDGCEGDDTCQCSSCLRDKLMGDRGSDDGADEEFTGDGGYDEDVGYGGGDADAEGSGNCGDYY